MLPWHSGGSDSQGSPSQAVPILCLLGVVALLSTITPAMKYVLEHSGLTFLSIANGRIVIGFLFLTVMTACWDWKGVRALTLSDGARFGALGLLGVGSYVVAAYGLLYTNVTHYALIYSLLPTFTAFFSWCLFKEQVSWSDSPASSSHGQGAWQRWPPILKEGQSRLVSETRSCFSSLS